MAEVHFGYLNEAGEWQAVTALEEDEYPEYYRYRARGNALAGQQSEDLPADLTETDTKAVDAGVRAEPLFEGHRDFQENQRGVSYETLLLPYLRGATEITIVDPYIRLPHQGRNLVDLLGLLASVKDPADEIAVKLVTKEDKSEFNQQHLLMLKEVQDSAASVGIKFNVAWDETIHDRSVTTDSGWKVVLGRGLDIFQKGSGSPYDIGARRQEFRQVAAFGVTYIREDTTSLN